ncbi:MAG: septum formation initiator family protein [Bacteroidales bacterium]|nr:septum formation initiator family protein [Bacteroidales bacterium]MBN2818494.1 septum formation initiator family protein [Bacteroidales bacterium]
MKIRFNIKNYLPVIFKLFQNKYFVAAFAFVVWVSLFDENNLLERRQLLKELSQLEKDKQYYTRRIEEDAARLRELQTNNDNLEKFAREQYLMHRSDEEVFVIVRK